MKFLSLTSLVVILVCTVLISIFISQRAKTILFKKSEQYAAIVAENLNHQVFFQFTVPTLIADGEIRLSRKTQYERLDTVVRSTIHGFAVERVNIYDPERILTYSTDSERVGTKGDLPAGVFERAMEGESISLLVEQGISFLGFEWKSGKSYLNTYLPMWEERPLSWKRGKILGVYELRQDVTRDYENIHRFQWIIAASFLIFVGILYMMISIIGRRADQIIAARASERNRLEEQLHQAERLAALGEMIAGVSHEIRNPLGIIRSTAEILQSRIENDRQKRFASIIVEESTRLNNIVTEFLDFARPKALCPAPCRIEDLIDRYLGVLEPECHKLGIEVVRRYDTGASKIEADGDLIYRALVNILANALQAMPEGGRLSIGTRISNGLGRNRELELRIGDTGAGIPDEIRKKIFNPFFTTREKGSGLGLAIVQSIIDSHRGEIDVESEPGAGTTFVIRLPLAHLQADEPQAASS